MNKENRRKPDYLVEVSWEVCNLVGGIYTVISTKARTLEALFGDKLVFVGPDLGQGADGGLFVEDKEVLGAWREQAEREGLRVRTGRWNVPGRPQVVLVDFEPCYAAKNRLYGDMWMWYGVDSLHAYGDYDEASMFALASALVVQSLYRFWGSGEHSLLAHFNEWTTGMGLLYLKHEEPAIATAFTTHATSIGRSIAGNNKPLYDYLPGYFGDQMAEELNMQSKHSVEKTAAREADVFTTVSDITARECTQLLERVPLVTPNGFEPDFVPTGAKYTARRKEARRTLINLAERMIGYKCEEEPFLVVTAGRYEYKNKGINVYIDAIDALRHQVVDREVIAFVMVPAWVAEARHDIQAQLRPDAGTTPHAVSDPIITHTLHNMPEDVILRHLHELHFRNEPQDRVKIIFVPSYLKGNDGILDKTYYQLLAGFDASVFPSYYEPWGYTPLESVAFGVPTVTTDLSGFGKWAKTIGAGARLSTGVKVVHRTDSNRDQVVSEIAETLREAIAMPQQAVTKMRAQARRVAAQAKWSGFIDYYLAAFDEALRVADKRHKPSEENN